MDHLLKALDSQNEAERIYAVQDIGELNDAQYTIPLINRLKLEHSSPVRESIVFCLKNVDCKEIYDDLFQLFRSTDAYLRNAAVMVFGSDGEQAVAFLESRLDDADKEVRKLILDALYETKSDHAKQAIRVGLNDPAENVVITAVEYLGLLNDSDSAEKMLKMLQRDSTVPMLKTAILSAILEMNQSDDMSRALLLFMTDSNIQGVDTLYFPEIVQLMAKTKDKQAICDVLYTLDDISVYAEDIIRAVNIAKQRFETFLDDNQIIDILMSVIQNSNIQNSIRSNAIELLLESSVVTSEQFYQLGLKIKNDEDMIFETIRFLELSGDAAGIKEITDIMNTTKDPELRVLCEEIVNQ
ncbi:HEAT repeat domain-containing protein [candidate division KSB1 bacterium]|nr:HEAT repeat domain-containing protein [candidate division KSB1 bacterium]